MKDSGNYPETAAYSWKLNPCVVHLNLFAVYKNEAHNNIAEIPLQIGFLLVLKLAFYIAGV